jgi:hypothetical protein
MSEMAKTFTFLGLALVSLVAAWATKPASADLDVASLVGQDLTKGFTDSTEAKRLRIVDFNEATATLREFEVAEEDGLWAIPSKDGYPADAERQMAQAATSLMDRKVLAVASEDAADHEQFGVIDPLSPKLEVGQKGVGRHVTISDINNEPLVDLVIGLEVKDVTNKQHFVREAGRDVVYIIELDPEPLSTNFEDWIEKDLLKLNPWDIEQVEIKDYSAELGLTMTERGPAIQVAWDPRSELTLAYNDTESKWSPVSLKKFMGTNGEHQEFSLTDDEELNSDKLNGLKSALDELEIVDVASKPPGLSADLKAGENFLDDREAITDLRVRGFAAVQAPGSTSQDLISNEGEVICTMKNGVEYVLRFGDLRMTAGGSEKKAQEAADGEAEPQSSGRDVQRYLFAMARFNEGAVKRPELEELPALPEVAEDSEDEAASPLEAEVEAEPSDADESSAEDGDAKQNDTDDASTSDSDSEADPEPASGDETAHDEASSDDEKSAELEKVIADRKRIETENQRKLDEYKDQLDQGRQTVKDLNLRFGDWYFVVSNDTFQKIRLGRDDVIQKKETDEPTAADGASAVGVPGDVVPGLPTIPGTVP